MKNFFILKDKFNTLKKEERRLLKKIENDTADCFDNTDLDKVRGAIEAIEFVFQTLGIR